MEETSSTPSTAAAASAAASCKTATTSSPMSKATTSVKLIIKASNQQFDDQIIESDLLWTVKRLKTHLSLVYPSKPAVVDQKLIYSGQLLNDTLQLKDVLRSYKDVYTQNHIFHLVYASKHTQPSTFIQKPKNIPVTTNMGSNSTSTADGLRQRNVPSTQQQQQEIQTQSPLPHLTYPQLFHPFMMTAAASTVNTTQCPPDDILANLQFLSNNIHNNNLQGLNSQQQQIAMYAWMQQVYAQYMNQYIQMFNSAGGSNPGLEASSAFNPYTLQQRSLFNFPNEAMNRFNGPVNPILPFSNTRPQSENSPAGDANTENAPVVAEQLQQPQPQQAAVPRFPNIVQDEPENRDWLDNFFSITRLAIFLTILYFNTSPMRCLIVFIIAGGIYLYHIGILRFRLERNNNNINRNNNAAADQIRQGVAQVQQAQAAQQQQENPNHAADVVNATNLLHPTEPNAVVDGRDEEGDGEEEGHGQNSTSMISFVRTFVVTFFTSLLPEPPAL